MGSAMTEVCSRRNATKLGFMGLGDSTQVDGRWPVVFGSGVAPSLDSVGVVAGSFDDAGIGAVPAFV